MRIGIAVFGGLLFVWLFATAYYYVRIRQLKIEMWNSSDYLWNHLFEWSNQELKSLPDSLEYSPQAKLLYTDLLMKFQSKIQEEKMKLSKRK